MDKKFRLPRVWSNRELMKFCKIFHGKAVNVSGWIDVDKEGGKYRNYFTNVSEYWITNYKSEARGFQGNQENEIYLDLEQELDKSMYDKFNIVFNHTVLEHIFDFNKAFYNLCKMSSDIVILVVPFLQEQHAQYGDYWRFTPQAVEKLFKKNDMKLIYINYNDNSNSSIYIFAIGSKRSTEWGEIINMNGNQINNISSFMLGTKIIKNSFLNVAKLKISKILNKKDM